MNGYNGIIIEENGNFCSQRVYRGPLIRLFQHFTQDDKIEWVTFFKFWKMIGLKTILKVVVIKGILLTYFR